MKRSPFTKAMIASGIAFGAISGLLQFGVRETLVVFAIVGAGDANAGYVASAVLTAGLLVATILATIAQLAFYGGRPERTVPTALALLALGACAALLGPATFYVTVALFAATCLYAIPAAADGRRMADAIAESCRVALAAPRWTLGILALLAAAIIVGRVIAGFFGVLPFVGDLIAGLLVQGVVATQAPRIAAAYLKLQPGPTGS